MLDFLKKYFYIPWKASFADKKFIVSFLVTAGLLYLVIPNLVAFITENEKSKGFSFTDPFLSQFTPVVFTWYVFSLIYGGTILINIYLIHRPYQLIMGLQIYALVMGTRFLTIWLLPLDPPTTIIPMEDPFIEFLGADGTLTKDLFFSGHTAASFLFFLLVKEKPLKIVFGISTTIMSVMILMQHVHYTVDIVVAPFVTYAWFVLVRNIHKRIGFPVH